MFLISTIVDTPQNRGGMPNADFSKWLKPEKIAQDFFDICNENIKIENGYHHIYPWIYTILYIYTLNKKTIIYKNRNIPINILVYLFVKSCLDYILLYIYRIILYISKVNQ